MLEPYDLKQIINEPTGVTLNLSSLIIELIKSKYICVDVHISDRSFIYCSICEKPPMPEHTIQTYRDCSRFDLYCSLWLIWKDLIGERFFTQTT